MFVRFRVCAIFPSFWAGAFLLAVLGCVPRTEHIEVLKKNEALRVANQKLERTIAQRADTIAGLEAQVENLQGFSPDRPADVFSPVSLEIVSLTGGDDYDGRPGDDGVTVYMRLRDADGSIVKMPGRFCIQLLDNSEPESPEVLGVYVFEDETTLRKSWYGRFGTQHFTFRCPFRSEAAPPRRVHVNAEFTDYLTGRVLVQATVVDISPTGA